jgi:ABC-2 type transport system ATP-binding protein
MLQVQVRNLRKRYGSLAAVEDVSFAVSGGEIFGMLGPNGAGKTSTLECVIGLRAPDAGQVEICGIDAAAQPMKIKQLIGAQLQSTALQDKITPREALKLFGSFYVRAADTEALIGRFSLTEKADATFDSLSGGQKQRLGLALAFVNQPRVVFLDEPTSGLDPQSRRELHQLIRQMRTDGHTVVLTTHYIDEAQMLCDRVAIVDRARVIATGTPAELVARAKSLPSVIFRAARPLGLSALVALPGVETAAPVGDGYRLRTASVSRCIIELVRLLENQQNELLDLQVEKPSLEDVFIELTGSSLRE